MTILVILATGIAVNVAIAGSFALVALVAD
jgi:hypothetical protein